MSDQTYLTEDLRRLRDETRVRLHLASMEARSQWEELEAKLRDFSSRAEFSRTGQGLDSALKGLRDELVQGYQRVRSAVTDRPEEAEAVPPRTEPAILPQTDLDDRIRRRAHEIWESRGRPYGSADQDWLAAEKELRSPH